MLALRGWGEAEFRLASPTFLAAVRAALFAEAGVKLLATAQIQAGVAVPDDAPMELRAKALSIRLPAMAEVKRIREALKMEPADG